MHRLTRTDLLQLIHGVIQCSRIKRHKSIPIVHSLETHQGQAALAELICEQIDNDCRMVIQTEFLHWRLGKWGVDEPDPTKASKAG